MKKHKKIILKNLKLRRIRNNLRLCIINAVYSQEIQLLSERAKIYWKNGVLASENVLKPNLEEKEKARTILHNIEKLNRQLNTSICKCPSCQSYEKDMIFYPPWGSWVCSDCYFAYHEAWEGELVQRISRKDF